MRNKVELVCGTSLDNNHKYFLECAKIHSDVIPTGFLPKLGLDFLSSLYRGFSTSKYSFLVLAVENSRVVGFMAVSLNTKTFFKQYLLTQAFKDIFRIPISIFGKVFLGKVLEVLKYPFYDKANQDHFVSNSEIFNFCVIKGMQGRGVGQLLFSDAVIRLGDNGVDILKIVTGQSQVGAQRFYYKCGARLSHKIMVHQGEESLVFKYNLSESN